MQEWLWTVLPSKIEAATGGNVLGVVGGLLAGVKLTRRSWLERPVTAVTVRDYLVAVRDGVGPSYTILMMALVLFSVGLRALGWTPYYLALASDHTEWALAWQHDYRGPATVMSALTSVLIALLLRFGLRPWFGRYWLLVTGLLGAIVWVAGAYLPRVL